MQHSTAHAKLFKLKKNTVALFFLGNISYCEMLEIGCFLFCFFAPAQISVALCWLGLNCSMWVQCWIGTIVWGVSLSSTFIHKSQVFQVIFLPPTVSTPQIYSLLTYSSTSMSKQLKKKYIVFPDANLQQLLAPGSFPYPCDLFIPWDLAGWEASSLSPTGLFAVASWQTAGGAHFDRMFHWHRGWLDRIGGLIEPPVEVGRPTFAAFRKRTVKTRRRNYFKRFQYLRGSRALVGAQ